MSFGRTIAEARKRKGLSLKELAANVLKEDGVPISPQYLNDIEHDRRNPPSPQLVEQFARQLDLSLEQLLFLAGQWPDDIRATAAPPDRVEAAFRAFRKELERRPKQP